MTVNKFKQLAESKKLSVAACHLQLCVEGDKDLLKVRDVDINSVYVKLLRF